MSLGPRTAPITPQATFVEGFGLSTFTKPPVDDETVEGNEGLAIIYNHLAERGWVSKADRDELNAQIAMPMHQIRFAALKFREVSPGNQKRIFKSDTIVGIHSTPFRLMSREVFNDSHLEKFSFNLRTMDGELLFLGKIVFRLEEEQVIAETRIDRHLKKKNPDEMTPDESELQTQMEGMGIKLDRKLLQFIQDYSNMIGSSIVHRVTEPKEDEMPRDVWLRLFGDLLHGYTENPEDKTWTMEYKPLAHLSEPMLASRISGLTQPTSRGQGSTNSPPTPRQTERHIGQPPPSVIKKDGGGDNEPKASFQGGFIMGGGDVVSLHSIDQNMVTGVIETVGSLALQPVTIEDHIQLYEYLLYDLKDSQIAELVNPEKIELSGEEILQLIEALEGDEGQFETLISEMYAEKSIALPPTMQHLAPLNVAKVFRTPTGVALALLK